MILYHYTTGQGLFGILEKAELHCSCVNFLNDPSEDTYFDDIVKIAIADSEEAGKIFNALVNDSFIKNVADPFGRFIVSFSKNKDSLSMWNYYAKGNGYNLGIDIDKLIETKKNEVMSVIKIDLVYNRATQIESIISSLLSFKDAYKEHMDAREQEKKAISEQNEDDFYDAQYGQMQIESEVSTKIHELSLGFKHPAYEREEEVRLIISEPDREKNTKKFKVSESGVFVEYLPLAFDLESSLKSIMIHPLSGPLHIEGTRRFLASKYRKHKIEIGPSAIPFRII